MRAMGKRVLGIDIGLKRTGLAVSDELGLSVRPLENRKPQNRLEDAKFIISLARELEVSDIVVGYPIAPHSGEEGPMAKRARGFKEALESEISTESVLVSVTLLDESYTSKNATKRLIASGVKKSKRNQLIDSEVARMLVEEFLAINCRKLSESEKT